MSWCRWVTDKAYGTAAYAYSWADYLLLSRLKPIAKAIYSSQPVAHTYQGFSQIFRLPEILSVSPETKQIVKQSLISNGQYLLSAIASERLVHKVYPQYDAIYSDTVGTALDWLLLVGFMGRLFVRRAVDNNCYLLSLPRAVSNDMASYISKQYSELLANALWKEFKYIFFRYSENDVNDNYEKKIHSKFVSELQKVFKNFILQPEIAATSFDGLRKALSKIFQDTIINAGSSDPKESIDKFSKKMAHIIVNEFFNGLLIFVPRFVKEIKGDFVKTLSGEKRSVLNDKEFLLMLSDRLLNKNDKLSQSLPTIFFEKINEEHLKPDFKMALDKDEINFIAVVNERRIQDQKSLIKILKAVFEEKSAERSAACLIQNVVRANAFSKNFLQSWMPLNNAGSCGCNKKKKIHASLSTAIYYSGNLLWLTVARKLLGFLPESYSVHKSVIWGVLFFLQMVTHGQGVNEYKIVGDGQCTRHRYKIFSKNKAHSFGVGLSYGLFTEILSRIISAVFQVDNLFTRDATANIVLQWVTLSTLANNKPLPGNGDYAWDVFFIQRKLTRKAVEGIDEWFIRDLNNLESQKRCINRIKVILSSKQTGVAIKYFLSGNDFIPNKDLINEINLLFKETLKYKDQPLTPSAFSDPLPVVFKLSSVQLFLKFYQKNINAAIPVLDSVHSWSKTLAGPLLLLPLPNTFASMFRIPLLLLKDEALYELIRKIESQMIIFNALSRQKPKEDFHTTPGVMISVSNQNIKKDRIKQVKLESDIKDAVSTESYTISKVKKERLAEAPSTEPFVTMPTENSELKKDSKQPMLKQLELEKNIEDAISSEIGVISILDEPQSKATAVVEPVLVVLTDNSEYKENDLNKIKGFEYMDLTPQTLREQNRPVHQKTPMVLFGVFSKAAKKAAKKMTQLAKFPLANEMNKNNEYELKRF